MGEKLGQNPAEGQDHNERMLDYAFSLIGTIDLALKNQAENGIPNADDPKKILEHPNNDYVGDLLDKVEEMNVEDFDFERVEHDQENGKLVLHYENGGKITIDGNAYKAIFYRPPELTLQESTAKKATTEKAKTRKALMETDSDPIADLTDKPKAKEPLPDNLEFDLSLEHGSRILEHQPDREALEMLRGINKNEPFVSFKNELGKQIRLRESAKKALDYAKKIAEKDGFKVILTSGYRSTEEQAKLFAASVAKRGPEEAPKWCAPPGKSWHQSGGAADVRLVDIKTGKKYSGEDYNKKLAMYMNRAGFVRYNVEYWHFEVGSEGWQKLVGEKIDADSTYIRDGNNEFREDKEIIDSNPAGEIHEEILKKIQQDKEKSPEQRKKDIEKLGNSSISDIRFNSKLLKELPENADDKTKITSLKEETRRRIDAYTSAKDGEWYTIDYESVGGHSHEMNIGLGDILMDPDIKEVLVQKRNGEVIKGTRGVTSGGRVAFLTPSGNYIPTFTGEKFRILTGNQTNTSNDEQVKTYMESYKQEEALREQENTTFVMSGAVEGSIGIDANTFLSKKVTTDEFIINKLNQKREQQDGQQILEFAKASAQQFGVPFEIYKEVIRVESGWNPGARYQGHIQSNASGLGQFIGSTWRRFMQRYNNGEIAKNPRFPTMTIEHKFDPYANAYATAWLLGQTKKSMSGYLEGKSIYQQGIVYYLAHHEGVGGAKTYLRLIDQMEKDGAKTKSEMMELYNSQPAKYSSILVGAQRSRISKYSLSTFLSVYFKFAKKVAGRALHSTPEALAKLREEYETTGHVRFPLMVPGQPSNEAPRGLVDVRGNQDRWIIGSSSAKRLNSKKGSKTGVIALGGNGPRAYLKNLKALIWPRIKHLQLPKEVTLVGMGVNGLNGGEVDANLAAYEELKLFFESKGVGVKIATLQPHQKNINKITAFNDAIRKKYGDNIIDIAAQITDGTKWKAGMADSDGLHLAENANKIFINMIENSPINDIRQNGSQIA